MQESCIGRQTRNSNLELLRIISMLLIVSFHYAVHGFNIAAWDYSINRYVIGTLSLGGKLGVSCFVLISGYFMVCSKITVHKLVKLIAEVWFYSVGIAVLFLTVLTPVEPLGIKNLIKAVVPIGYYEYCFMTDYVILMLLSPVINIAIEKMNRAFYRNMILLFVGLWSVIPSLTKANYGYNDLIWFVVLYFIAGYIRKYVHVSERNASKHLAVAAITYLAVIISDILLIGLGHWLHIDFLLSHSAHFGRLNSPFILLTSVELLIGFAKMKRHECAWLNKLASATLGVYLIHDNNMIRPYLWHTILKTESMYSSNFLIGYALLSTVGVYIVCTLIDLIRQGTVERVFLALLDRCLPGIEKGLVCVWNQMERKVQAMLKLFCD